MAYDPIINYYDKPGGPSVPGSDSGSGGGGDHGGGSSSEGGYTYEAMPFDLVHEQTINLVEGTGDYEGLHVSPIVVDTQACEAVDMTEGNVDVVCVIDGTEYAADASVYDGKYSFNMDVAYIEADLNDGYIFKTSNIPLGDHVIRIYYEAAMVTFKKPFMDAIKNELANSGIGTLEVKMTPDNTYVGKWTLDKNCFEIWNAYASGKRVLFVDSSDTYNNIPIVMDNVTYMSRPSWSVEQFSFELFGVVSNNLRHYTYTVRSNTMTRTIEDYALTPVTNG